MNSVLKTLPDDVVELKEIITTRDQIIQHQQCRIEQLEEFIRTLNHRHYGASSEKSSGQGELFDEAEQAVDPAEAEDTAASNDTQTPEKQTQANQTPAKKPGRKPLPKDLPRTRIEHDIPESEKICACGCGLTLIGEETSEQLDIIPAQVQVLVHVRKKYACQTCEQGVTLAPLPAQPIPKSMASPGLLAHIASAKYRTGHSHKKGRLCHHNRPCVFRSQRRIRQPGRESRAGFPEPRCLP